jgi:hypothetical protein
LREERVEPAIQDATLFLKELRRSDLQDLFAVRKLAGFARSTIEAIAVLVGLADDEAGLVVGGGTQAYKDVDHQELFNKGLEFVKGAQVRQVRHVFLSFFVCNRGYSTHTHIILL